MLILALWNGPPTEGWLAGAPDQETAQLDSSAKRKRLQQLTQRLAELEQADAARSAAATGLEALSRQRYDAAVDNFRFAALRQESWEYWNDLAVSHLARAHDGEKPFDLLHAATSAKKAVERAPRQPETQFNYALALTKLHLKHSALIAWETFLRNPPSDGGSFRQVAESYKRSLERPSAAERWHIVKTEIDASDPGELQELVRRFPGYLREYAERDLTYRWSLAVDAGRLDEAKTLQERGLLLGNILAEEYGEESVANIYSTLGACSINDELLAACVEGCQAFESGYKAFKANNYKAAVASLEKASSAFARVPIHVPGDKNALHRWVDYYYTYANFFDDIQRAYNSLDEQITPEVEKRYPSLAGKLHWRRGVAAGLLLYSQEARNHFIRGQQLLERGSGLRSAAFGHNLIAEEYDDIGDNARAWRHRMAFFKETVAAGEPRAIHSMLNGAAQALLRHQDIESAQLFINELIHHNRKNEQPELLTEAYRERAQYYLSVAENAKALADVERARTYASALGTSARRTQILATLDLVAAAAWVERDPAHANSLLDQVLARSNAANNTTYHLKALEERGKALLNEGRTDEALNHWLKAIELFEIQRDHVKDASRVLALYQTQPLYDAVVSALLEQQKEKDALAIAERARARYLLDLHNQGSVEPSAPIKPSEIRERVPAGTGIVYYTVLKDQLIAWIIDEKYFRISLIPVTAQELQRLVKTLRQGLIAQLPEAILQKESSTLYQTLIAPLALNFNSYDRIVFIPDRDLFRVPFSALYDEKQSRYLIEAVAVAVAPSATLFFAETDPRRHERDLEVIVSDPDLRGTPYESWPRLHRSGHEAERLGTIYPEAIHLSGRAATTEALLEVLPRARLFHYVGHFKTSPYQVDRSALLLASSKLSDGSFTADHLLSSEALGTPFVVLSACQTAEGFAIDRESPLGLATVFMATGSQAVVATLVDLKDGASTTIMENFHASLSAGQSASAAMRRAMLKRIEKAESVAVPFSAWANFVVFETFHNS